MSPGAFRIRVLHRVGQGPPLLDDPVGGHHAEVRLEVVADVLVVGEQQASFS